MTVKIEEQSQFKLIVEHLQESILVACDNQIDMVNNTFIRRFIGYVEDDDEDNLQPR